MAKARSKTPRKKKDGGDPGKKRRRTRRSVAARKTTAGGARPSRDEVDTVKYKKGSAGERTRRGAP
jgi:hypothetical protein